MKTNEASGNAATSEPSSDRRTSPRYEFSGEADVVWDETTSPLAADVKDISLGGCFLTTRKELPLNAPVKLRLHLGGGTIEIQGTVRRSKAGIGVAIEFSDPVRLGD